MPSCWNHSGITVTPSGASKVYDGTTSSAGVPTITTGSLGVGDSGTWTQTYATAPVGSGKTLIPTGSVSDGNGGANFDLSFLTLTNPSTGVVGRGSPVEAVFAAEFVAEDPVCGMSVDTTAGKPQFSYQGTIYHFCCNGCRGKFEADPEAYLAKQIKFDPDIWIVEVEDRAGRNFLDTVVG